MSPSAYYVERRKTKKVFLKQINQIIDWDEITRLLERYYTKGQSARGRKAHRPLVLFKMCLLQTWYGLSDYEIEEQVNDVLSFMRFCDLQLEDEVPDHSIICRFRKILSDQGAWDVLLQAVNKQLKKKEVIVKQGAIVDASITPTPRKHKGHKIYHLTEDAEKPVQAAPQRGVHTEGSWVKKQGKFQYGYKRHYACEQQAGLVLGVSTTTASAHSTSIWKKY